MNFKKIADTSFNYIYIKNISIENDIFYKIQFLWSNSCFLDTQETRSSDITFRSL